MIRAAAVLFLAAFTASAAIDVRQVPTSQQRQELLDKGWSAARDEIATALRQGYIPSRSTLAGSTQNPAFLAWLHLWEWFDLFAKPQSGFLERYIRAHIVVDSGGKLTMLGPGVEMPEELRPMNDGEWTKIASQIDGVVNALKILSVDGSLTTGDAIGKDFAKILIGDDAFSRAFFETLSEDDYVPAVLQNLKSIWTAYPAQFKAYGNLAIALAVVFDQPAPFFWPHHQVSPNKVPLEDIAVAERFDFWIKSNESRRLMLDLGKLNAPQLKFVVDALVNRKELEWAQGSVKYQRRDFARAFGSVRYDTPRLRMQQYSWPGEEYTLAEIRSRGGICVDQAYFAMLSGKAHGLPTLFFVGQGADGGHAWFGYLKTDDKWDMDGGRYENQNYAVGQAYDPQTWTPISDHELSYLAARFRDTPAYLASLNELTMARMLENAGDTAKAAKAFEGAVSVCPMHAEAWEARTGFLHRTNATQQVLKQHLEAGLRQFTNNQDVRTDYQMDLAALARSQGDEKTAKEYESKVVQQNRRHRSDISVGAAAKKLNALLAEKQFDAAAREYRSLALQLGSRAGGNFFYEIVAPYVNARIANGTPEDLREAMEALFVAEKRLQPKSGSILAKAITKLKEKVNEAK